MRWARAPLCPRAAQSPRPAPPPRRPGGTRRRRRGRAARGRRRRGRAWHRAVSSGRGLESGAGVRRWGGGGGWTTVLRGGCGEHRRRRGRRRSGATGRRGTRGRGETSPVPPGEGREQRASGGWAVRKRAEAGRAEACCAEMKVRDVASTSSLSRCRCGPPPASAEAGVAPGSCAASTSAASSPGGGVFFSRKSPAGGGGRVAGCQREEGWRRAEPPRRERGETRRAECRGRAAGSG